MSRVLQLALSAACICEMGAAAGSLGGGRFPGCRPVPWVQASPLARPGPPRRRATDGRGGREGVAAGPPTSAVPGAALPPPVPGRESVCRARPNARAGLLRGTLLVKNTAFSPQG